MIACQSSWAPPPEFAVGLNSGYAQLRRMMIQPANDSPDLTALERSVLETAFASMQTDPGFRNQIDAAVVVVRTPSGVGFVTKLQIPEEYRVANGATGIAVPVIIGEHPALPAGAEFILQIKNGLINCIEAFCHAGMWPADESQFQIHLGQSLTGS